MSDVNMATMLPVGTILHGTYRIESYLSSGGFGNTYKVTNIEFHETYAIKEFFVKGVCQREGDSTTISVSNSDNVNSFVQQKEKFKKEARRLRDLDNPHVVKVYDLFEENGTAYYVMDYVDGESLSTRLKRTRTPLSETAVRNYLSQILDGLEAIHAAGIWHLDIKPANIMVDSHYKVKLIDFGSSKQQSATGGATASTGISYTNGYAPSEQMAQSYDKFGPWTDFYALGATVFKLLTNQDPPKVSDLNEDESEDKHVALPMPNASAEMRSLVVWMMQVNRLKRPQSTNEILQYLKGVGIDEILDSLRGGNYTYYSGNSTYNGNCSYNDESTEYADQMSAGTKRDDEIRITTIDGSNDTDNSSNDNYDEEYEEEVTWKDLFSFEGRIGRLEFLLSLVVPSVALVCVLFGLLKFSSNPSNVLIGIMIIFFIIYLWIIYAQGSKRCHDMGHSGWFQCIPYFVIAMLFGKGKADNEYGKSHKSCAIKNGKPLLVIFIVGVVFVLFGSVVGNRNSGVINDGYYETADSVAVDTAAADSAYY